MCFTFCFVLFFWWEDMEPLQIDLYLGGYGPGDAASMLLAITRGQAVYEWTWHNQ